MLSAKLRLNPSIKHLLISSKVSSDFWNHVLSWLRDKSTIVGNVKGDISFGKCDVKKDFLLVNQIFLLGKYHIYSQKMSQGYALPSGVQYQD